ncbi:hypothetical protein [Sphingobium sp. HWE2-09]|uniref:hypothetical protein n=1 Tax=Sphingobium sp. HWE2-09 TaxID=3108390 RepID=UPI002DC7B17F|nr:hypothetical protein [Sphingobium sp. HWE2-09]
MFAKSFSGRPLSLGADVTLPLLGGDRLQLSGIVSDLELDWQPGLMRFVEDACADQRVRGRDWFVLPPMLLGGEAGVGRTHFARRLARAAGVSHIMFDARTWMFTWRCAGPDVQLPLPIAAAMTASGCANPVVSVTGAHRATSAMVDLLVRLTDRSINGSLVDEAAGVVFDYSAVTWIIHAPPPQAAPLPLIHAPHQRPVEPEPPVADVLARHLHRIDLKKVGPDHYRLLIIDLLAEVLDDLGTALPPLMDLQALLDQACKWRDPSVSQIYDRLLDEVRLHVGDDHPL